MQRPKWIPRWLSVPLIVFTAFIAWMLFSEENNFLKAHELKTKVNELATQIEATKDSTTYYEQKINELNTDPETLEKIAREHYGMKGINEDVYVTDIP